MIRTAILFCLCAFLSDAWTFEFPPSHSSCRVADRSETTFSCRDSRQDETNLSRRSLLNFVPIMGLTVLASPSFAADVDPFAAMDDMLSSGAAGPGMSSSSNGSNSGTTKANPNPTQNSDMAEALQESKQRKNIAPRTHG